MTLEQWEAARIIGVFVIALAGSVAVFGIYVCFEALRNATDTARRDPEDRQ